MVLVVIFVVYFLKEQVKHNKAELENYILINNLIREVLETIKLQTEFNRNMFSHFDEQHKILKEMVNTLSATVKFK